MADERKRLTGYFLAGIDAASPGRVLPQLLPSDPPKGRTLVLGCGKAAAEMALVARRHLKGPVSGCVVTRQGHNVGAPIADIEVLEARHPVPDGTSSAAGARLLALAQSAGPEDRVLFLISGGGSSLLCAPAPGIEFAEKQAINDALVRSGKPIEDINLVRRHLSALKGGRLAAAAGARGAALATYVISDVASEDPALVASGPSIIAPFEPERALAVLESIAWPISARLAAAMRANSPPLEAPHPVHVIAQNEDAIACVRHLAAADGLTVVDLGQALTGHAADVGARHGQIAREHTLLHGQFLLLSGGELTVNGARHDGRGGPNLEYLAGVMSQFESPLPIHALAGDSDGIDGTEDNAGAYFDAAAADPKGAKAALATNRTYDFFAARHELVMTGPTRTNVNDIRMILVTGQRP